jgi:hypothetical protein
VNSGSTCNEIHRQQVALVELLTVRDNQIDLIGRIPSPYVPVRRMPVTNKPHDHDITFPSRRLALDAKRSLTESKD